jgi:hypothetical protein
MGVVKQTRKKFGILKFLAASLSIGIISHAFDNHSLVTHSNSTRQLYTSWASVWSHFCPSKSPILVEERVVQWLYH